MCPPNFQDLDARLVLVYTTMSRPSSNSSSGYAWGDARGQSIKTHNSHIQIVFETDGHVGETSLRVTDKKGRDAGVKTY